MSWSSYTIALNVRSAIVYEDQLISLSGSMRAKA